MLQAVQALPYFGDYPARTVASGLAGWIAVLLLAGSSLVYRVRAQAFELWLRFHWLLFVAMVAALAVHGKPIGGAAIKPTSQLQLGCGFSFKCARLIGPILHTCGFL